MQDEQARAEDERMTSFKGSMLAANLANAKRVLEMFEQIEDGKSDSFIKPDEIRPLTVEDKQHMLQELRKLGI